jgi:transposase
MKPYSLDMSQNIVNTYEAGSTSVRKVAERFQGSKSTVQELLKRKRETGKLLPRQAKGGETEPTLWSGITDQRDGRRTSRLHISRIL